MTLVCMQGKSVFCTGSSTPFSSFHRTQNEVNQIDHIWPEPYAGPMVELDGTRRAPDFFVPYVSFIILASILTPLAGLGYLVWEGQTDLGISTLGVYVLCLVVQIASESVSLRLGEPSSKKFLRHAIIMHSGYMNANIGMLGARPPDPSHPGYGGWGELGVVCRSCTGV